MKIPTRLRPLVLKTPEAKVEWCLRFATQDLPPLTQATAGRRNAAWAGLAAVAGYPRFPPPPAALLDETHGHLARAIRAIATGQHVTVAVPTLVWTFEPPPSTTDKKGRRGQRDSAPIKRTSDAARQGWHHLPSVAVLALIDALDAIGADRLRACPLERCGKVVLAHHRQRYCDKQHAQEAAMQAWLAVPANNAKRKLGRTDNRRRSPRRK